MGATYRQRGKKYLVSVHSHGDTITKMVASKQDAEALVRHVHKLELAGVNVLESIRQARQKVATSKFPLVREALPQWIAQQQASSEIRQSSATAYLKTLHRWVFCHILDDNTRLGDLSIDQLTREHIGQVLTTAKAAGRSRSVLNHIRHPLHRFFVHLNETKAFTGPNPAADLKFFIGRRGAKVQTDTSSFFSHEEAAKVFAAAEALFPRYRAFIMTGVLAGLRWGESAALYRGDIDFARGRIHVQRTVSGNGGGIQPPKNGRARYVKVGKVVLAALRAQLEVADLEAQANEWTPDQRKLVFPGTLGQPTHYTHFLSKVWRPLLAKAKVPYRKYHSTRHTFATWLLEDGADIRYVQAQLGHATIGQTADTYGHLVPTNHDAAMDRLDRFVEAPGARRQRAAR